MEYITNEENGQFLVDSVEERTKWQILGLI